MQLKQQLLIAKQPEIGKLIREIRQEMQLTQEKLANELGVTFATLNRWENGRTTPSPLAMEKIEKLLYEPGERQRSLVTKYFPKKSNRFKTQRSENWKEWKE